MYNITKVQDFSNHIPIKNPHQIVSRWELKMNLICQNDNDYKSWLKYIERLISKKIPSDRIQKELNLNAMSLILGYSKMTEKGKFVPVALLNLIFSFLPKVSPRIYEDLWLNANPREYKSGLGAIKPPPDAPATNNKKWIRKYFHEDLQDHLDREDKILDYILNSME